MAAAAAEESVYLMISIGAHNFSDKFNKATTSPTPRSAVTFLRRAAEEENNNFNG